MAESYGERVEMLKKQKSNAVLKNDLASPPHSTAINLTKMLGEIKTQSGLHRRTGSENLKKVKIETLQDSAVSQKQGKASSGKRPSSQVISQEKSSQKESENLTKIEEKNDKTPRINQQLTRPPTDSQNFGISRSILQNYHKKKTTHLDSIKHHEAMLPPFEGAKVILKDFGRIKSFSVNTHQGIFRNYNEDRVSILLNAQQR